MTIMGKHYASLASGFVVATIGLTPMAAGATGKLHDQWSSGWPDFKDHATPSDPRLCQVLERQLDRCEGDAGLGPWASCDRVAEAYRALCGEVDTIYAEASAAGTALDLLSRDYAIVDIEEVMPSFAHTHVVVGPAALDRPRIMRLVVRAYQLGLTVAIANATQAEADRFDGLVHGAERASCLPGAGRSKIALYALQQSPRQDPLVDARYCLPELADHDLDVDNEQSVRQWLRERFASAPPVREPESLPVATVNLDDLAKKTHCSELVVNAQGQIQQDIFLSSLRSFDQEADYYYVNSFVQYVPRVSQYSFSTNVARPSAGTGFNDLLGTRLLFTEPGTTTEAISQYTNSRSTTVSGGVGFGNTGFNVEASVSVTVGTSNTVTVPPVTILNTSNLATATPIWSFQPAVSVPNTLFDTLTTFLWIVDRNVYPNSGEGINDLFSFFGSSILPNVLELQGQCDFSVPFPTWEVGPPEITSVEPSSVRRSGGSFLILGEQMYPSIVTDVLLGGDPLSSANFVPIDDTEIRVVVPGGQSVGSTPVQVNTLFNGQILPSNNDIEVDIRPR